MKRKIGKVLLIMTCIFLTTSSTALAANKSGTFSYNNKIATATLNVTWSAFDPDYGKARTEWAKDAANNVTAYLEAQDSSSSGAVVSAFDNGFIWAECNISRAGV